MKKKIAENPNKKYFIRRGEICCEEETLRRRDNEIASPVKPQWRPPPFKKPGPSTADKTEFEEALRRPIKPVSSDTSTDGSEIE